MMCAKEKANQRRGLEVFQGCWSRKKNQEKVRDMPEGSEGRSRVYVRAENSKQREQQAQRF